MKDQNKKFALRLAIEATIYIGYLGSIFWFSRYLSLATSGTQKAHVVIPLVAVLFQVGVSYLYLLYGPRVGFLNLVATILLTPILVIVEFLRGRYFPPIGGWLEIAYLIWCWSTIISISIIPWRFSPKVVQLLIEKT